MSVKFTYYDDIVIVSAKGDLMGGKETDDYHQMVKDLISGEKQDRCRSIQGKVDE